MNSFIPWVGGKRILRKRIIEEFPKDIDRYIEVFGGADWVLFGSDKHAPFEVFNDIDSDLINLYRCIKYHKEELQRELSFVLHSREEFNNYLSQMKAEGLTDIQRAARYFVIIRGSFGANRRNFRSEPCNLANKSSVFSEINKRLSDVIIENRDFEQIIKTYDRTGALFYLDPPYYAVEKYYNGGFCLADHKRLHSILKEIKGKFILSYNADNAIREMYHDFTIIPVKRFNQLSAQSNNTEYKEVIIKNY